MKRLAENSACDICFLQYSLPGGGAERKICTLSRYFVNYGYNVEIGLFGNNEVTYTFDPRIKITFIDRNTYEYMWFGEKALYRLKKWITTKLICYPIIVLEKVFQLFRCPFPAQLASERLQKHFIKKYDFLQPVRSYVRHRPNAVLITMMVHPYVGMRMALEKEYDSGKISNPYLVMECNNPKPGLDSSIKDDERRNIYYPRASRVLVMTRGAKDYFRDEIRHKCEVIPNPIRDDLPPPYLGKRRKTIVTYCRFVKQKNLPLLIEAFEMFHMQFSEYSLEIYGEGELLHELESMISEKQLTKCAHIFPFDPALHERIRDCAMFVSSSDWEGFSNSILEALSLGIPVIATNCDFGTRDMIQDHVNGLLVPVRDAKALTEAMVLYARDENLAERISRQAILSVEKYSVGHIGKHWLSIIEEIRRDQNRNH